MVVWARHFVERLTDSCHYRLVFRGVYGYRSLRERLAAAPITWGVCEVPGWGYQLTPEEVLSDMAALGFHAHGIRFSGLSAG